MWNKSLKKEAFKKILQPNKISIIYDLETTGLSPKNDSIIEIGALKVKSTNGLLKVIDTLHEYINPKKELREKITEITGITNDFLKNKKCVNEIYLNIENFFKNVDFVCGYNNKRFDNKFMINLYNFFNRENFEDFETLDIYELSKEVLPEKLNNFKLSTVAENYNIKFKAHSAIEDTKCTFEILKALLNEPENLCGTQIVTVYRFNYFRKSKVIDRIYFATNIGYIYYDIYKGCFDSKELDLKKINMNQFYDDILNLSKCKDIKEIISIAKKK